MHQPETESEQEMSQRRMSQPQLPPQPPVRNVQYNPDHTYVAVIVSDGDNMQVRGLNKTVIVVVAKHDYIMQRDLIPKFAVF